MTALTARQRTAREIAEYKHVSAEQKRIRERELERESDQYIRERERRRQKTEEKNAETITEAGRVCSFENMTEETDEIVAANMQYLQDYALYQCQGGTKPIVPDSMDFTDDDGETHKSIDALFSAFLKQGGLEHAKSRGDTFEELVGIVIVEAVEIFGIQTDDGRFIGGKGCDKSQKFPIPQFNKYGGVYIVMKDATHALKGIMRGCAARLLHEAGASVNLSAIADGQNLRLVNKAGNDRDPDPGEISRLAKRNLTRKQQLIVDTALSGATISQTDEGPKYKMPSTQEIADGAQANTTTVRKALTDFAKEVRALKNN